MNNFSFTEFSKRDNVVTLFAPTISLFPLSFPLSVDQTGSGMTKETLTIHPCEF